MAIKYTVTSNLQSPDKKGYSGKQKHTEHDPKLKHANKNIDILRTEFNRYANTKERKQKVAEWNEEKFHDYVEEHDKHQRETGHGERQWGSVKAYLSNKNKPTGVLTLGNVQVQSELLKQLCPADVLTKVHSPEGYDYITFDLQVHEDPKTGELMTDVKKYPDEAKRLQKVRVEAEKFYKCLNDALFAATPNTLRWKTPDGNVVHMRDYLYIGRKATNIDEGAGHLHFELAACGRTRKGNKITCSLNQALVSLHHAVTGKYASGSKSMSWLRSYFDRYALDNFNKNLQKAYGLKEPPLEFYRKTKDDSALLTGLSMKQFKALKKQQDLLAEQGKKLDKQTADNRDQTNKLKNATDDVRKVYKATVNHPKSAASPLEMARDVRHAVKSLKEGADQAQQNLDALTKQREAQEKALAEASQHFAEVKQHLAEVTRQVQQELDKKDELDKREVTVQQQEQQLNTDKKAFNQQVEQANADLQQQRQQVLQRRRNLSVREQAVEQEAEHQQNFMDTFVSRFVEYVKQKMPNTFKVLELAVRDRLQAEQSKDAAKVAEARQREEMAKQAATKQALTTKQLFDFSAIEQHNDMDNLHPDPDYTKYTKRAQEIADDMSDAFLDGLKPVEAERDKKDKQKDDDGLER